MSKKTDHALKKCDELINRLTELKKALDSVNLSSNRIPMNALGTGWSMDQRTGSFHHSSHGIISTSKHPEGYFEIKHGGRSVGRAKDMNEAGARIKNYVRSLKPGDTGMHNLDPMSVGKNEDLVKSNYGPKGGGQYTAADNVRRKMGNVGDIVGEGANINVKSYSTKPGQLSAKQQAAVEAKKAKQLSGKVKQYTPEQIAAINEARKLKKNFEESGSWANHSGIPSADEEVVRAQSANPPQVAEDLMANQLANLMLGRSMLGKTPPPQPNNEEMFGHLVVSEEVAKAAEQQWGGAINNWLAEAQKPISSRFNSEEEELAYWASIKVSDRDDGNSGY